MKNNYIIYMEKTLTNAKQKGYATDQYVEKIQFI